MAPPLLSTITALCESESEAKRHRSLLRPAAKKKHTRMADPPPAAESAPAELGRSRSGLSRRERAASALRVCVCAARRGDWNPFRRAPLIFSPAQNPPPPTHTHQSGTVAAAAAIASVTPHGTGAIDVVMVRSPLDGVTRSSPFYVRFGKYTGARSADRRVAVEVNGKDSGFCMHLGRTGEACFLAQGELEREGKVGGPRCFPSPQHTPPHTPHSTDEHDWDDRAAHGGAASPLGYSSGDDVPAPPSTALGAHPPPPPSPRTRSLERVAAAAEPDIVIGSAPARSGEDGHADAAASSPPPTKPRAPSRPPRPPPSTTACDDEPGMLGGVLSPDPAPRSPLGVAVDGGSDCEGATRVGGASPSPASRSPPSAAASSSSPSDSDTSCDPATIDAATSPPAHGLGDTSAAASPRAHPLADSVAASSPPPRRAHRAGPTIDLALVPPADIVGAPPDAVRAALDAGTIAPSDWRARGGELVTNKNLLAIVGGVAVHRWSDAAPALAGGLAYGGDWAALLPPPLALAAPPLVRADSGSADGGGDRATESRLASLRGWLASFRGAAGGAPLQPSSLTARRPSPLAPDAARDAALASALARAERHRRHRRSFLPTQPQLAALPVSPGRNTVDFVYGRQRLRAYIYVVPPGARVVVSDIDGTVTRSDMLGHVLPRVGVDWSHGGIARLFTDVAANGYSLLYLSSRSIAQASATRDYLHSVDQGGDRLPAGPVLMSPDGLVPSLYRELILRRPHEFKIRCLEDVRALFPPGASPFHAGFGNRDTDEVSYLAVGIPPPPHLHHQPARRAAACVRGGGHVGHVHSGRCARDCARRVSAPARRQAQGGQCHTPRVGLVGRVSGRPAARRLVWGGAPPRPWRQRGLQQFQLLQSPAPHRRGLGWRRVLRSRGQGLELVVSVDRERTETDRKKQEDRFFCNERGPQICRHPPPITKYTPIITLPWRQTRWP